MSRVMLSVSSFVAGASLMFLMLSGSQTSISAQPSSQELVRMEGAIPVVPPVMGHFKDSTFSGGKQQLDGVDCEGCVFKDVALEYSGGSFRFANSSFSGPVRVTFKGAAFNTLVVLQLVQALQKGNQPKQPNPKSPIQRTATPPAAVNITLASPYPLK